MNNFKAGVYVQSGTGSDVLVDYKRLTYPTQQAPQLPQEPAEEPNAENPAELPAEDPAEVPAEVPAELPADDEEPALALAPKKAPEVGPTPEDDAVDDNEAPALPQLD